MVRIKREFDSPSWLSKKTALAVFTSMNDILLKIVPVILVFLLGYALKRLNVLKKEDGDLFLRIVFYIALPSLIILSIANIDLRFDFVFLPIAAALIVFTTSIIAFWAGGLLKLPKPTFGAFIVGAAIMNIGFTLPFVIAAYGQEGLARITMFDFGNGLLTFTFVYYLACKYGTIREFRQRICGEPPFIFYPFGNYLSASADLCILIQHLWRAVHILLGARDITKNK